MSNLAPSIQLSVAEKRAGDITRRAMCRKKTLLGETFISKCGKKKKQRQRKMQTVARAGTRRENRAGRQW